MRADDLAKAMLDALDDGLFQHLYRLASVDPKEVVSDLAVRGSTVDGLESIAQLGVEELDPVVDHYVRDARRQAAISGLSLGAGGWLGLPPGLMHLVVSVVRLAQRISLAYGFDYRTDRGEIELWKALARAVDADVDFEGSEAELLRRLPAVVTGTGTFQNPLLLKALQAVVTRIALGAGLHITRWVPVVGGGSGMLLNYLQVGQIGRRLKASFRERHALGSFDRNGAIEVEVLR